MRRWYRRGVCWAHQDVVVLPDGPVDAEVEAGQAEEGDQGQQDHRAYCHDPAWDGEDKERAGWHSLAIYFLLLPWENKVGKSFFRTLISRILKVFSLK